MEMAISTIVVMVLGILIVGGGMVLVTKVTNAGDDIFKKLSAQSERELQDRMDGGQLVAVAPSTQHAQAGKSVTYGVGILNKLDEEEKFSLGIVGTDSDGNPDPAMINNADTTGMRWRVSRIPTINVSSNSRATAPVIVTPGKRVAPGDYTFLVNVTYNDGGTRLYDSTRFFTVRVD